MILKPDDVRVIQTTFDKSQKRKAGQEGRY